MAARSPGKTRISAAPRLPSCQPNHTVPTGFSAEPPPGPATPIALHPVEFDAPVGCAGVAIYPGDVIVGNGEGVVAIPRHLVEELVDECLDATDYETFVAAHVRRGRSILGLFPATPESRAEYDQWVAAGRPSLET